MISRTEYCRAGGRDPISHCFFIPALEQSSGEMDYTINFKQLTECIFYFQLLTLSVQISPTTTCKVTNLIC